jgi:CRP-like cAMP-binding protein
MVTVADARPTPADLAAVKATPMFAELGEATIRRVIGETGVRRFERGQTIFIEGEPAEAFFVVLDGWVKLFRTLPDGDEAVVAMIAAGECFAEAVMFLGGRYPVSAEAVGAARLLRIEAAAVRSAIRADGQVAVALIASLAHHTERLTDQVEGLEVLSTAQRVADFLARTARIRAAAGDAIELVLPYDKAIIARRLGMTPESLSRALATLRPLGVSVDREKVRIASLARLADYVGRRRRPAIGGIGCGG